MAESEYVKAFREFLATGVSIDVANDSNHKMLEQKKISLADFHAAARILVELKLKER